MITYFIIPFDTSKINNDDFRIWLGYNIKYLKEVFTIPTLNIEYFLESTISFDITVDLELNQLFALTTDIKTYLENLMEEAKNAIDELNAVVPDENEHKKIFYSIVDTYVNPIQKGNSILDDNYRELLDEPLRSKTSEEKESEREFRRDFKKYVLGLE